MIHRAMFGSMERFIGILIEHYGGALPVWLSPVQVKILPISDRFIEKAAAVEKTFKASGIRVETDIRAEKIGYKIREAEVSKIPYMAIIGEKELESGSLSIRQHGKGDIGTLSIEDFIKKVSDENQMNPIFNNN
jgi:threonyl-tRNA synthetase